MNHKQIIALVGVCIAAPVLGYGLYILILWGSWDFETNFLTQERCMQNGGVYSMLQERCWQAGQCEDEGGFWYPRESRCVFDESTIKE